LASIIDGRGTSLEIRIWKRLDLFKKFHRKGQVSKKINIKKMIEKV